MRATRRNTNKLMRSDIAQAAARIIAEGSAETFAAAKRKAALTLSAENNRNMPDNQEIQKALIEYLRLFEGERFTNRIDAMRREALRAMEVLSAFKPRLVGPVLYGSACDYSPVTLHLYTDELESVTRFFHQRETDYRLCHTVLKTAAKRQEEFPLYLVENEGLDFELVIFPEAFFAHPPLSSLDGRPFRRADAVALQKLIDESQLSIPLAEDVSAAAGGS